MTVDIAVANYNNGRYLIELIHSILAQDNENWKLFIVDDASTDNSMALIKPFVEDDRIKVIAQTFNRGATATFKTAIDAGEGEIVALLGADDTLPPNCIGRLIHHFDQRSKTGTIYTAANQCDSRMNYVQPWPLTEALNPDQDIFEQISRVFNLIAFRRKVYDDTPGLNPALRRAMDHDLIYKLDEAGTIEFVDEPLYNYRVHEGGISQGGANGQIAMQYAILAKLDAFKRRGLTNAKRQESRRLKAVFHLRTLQHFCKYIPGSWFTHFLKSIWYQPSNFFLACKALIRIFLKKPSPYNGIHISNLEKRGS